MSSFGLGLSDSLELEYDSDGNRVFSDDDTEEDTSADGDESGTDPFGLDEFLGKKGEEEQVMQAWAASVLAIEQWIESLSYNLEVY